MEINRHIPRDPVVGERVDHYQSQLYATKDITLGTVELYPSPPTFIPSIGDIHSKGCGYVLHHIWSDPRLDLIV